MKVDKETLWPIEFRKYSVNFFEEQQYLINVLEDFKSLDWKNVSGQKFNTTVNGYQPDADILSLDHPIIEDIKKKIINPISEEYWMSLRKDKISLSEQLQLIHKAWLVEYNTGSYQNLHVHKSSLFTAVWTLYREEQDEVAGQIHLHNPIVGSYTLGFYKESKKITAKENEILVFPSWIAHNVTPCTAKRIVFVWDTMVIPKNA